MIVRASDNLTDAVRRASSKSPTLGYPRIKAWTGLGIITPPSIRKSQEIQMKAINDAQKLVAKMPKWMYDSLIEGSVLTMENDDYCALDYDLRMELEILTR
jgi:hypothetical protein